MARFPLHPLGSTSLSVTRLGLGLAALGRPGYIALDRDEDLGPRRDVETMRERTHEVLDAAYAAGIRYLDAARSYGRAEEFLASWLDARGLDAGEVTLGSKWGYAYTGNWRLDAAVHEVKDHSLAALRRQAAESRAILGTHLNLYQVHSVTLESGILEDRAVLAELAGLRDTGLVIGLSLSGPDQATVARRALEVSVGGVSLFASVQATWNLLETSVEPALAEAHAAGWGVIIKEALANGRLTSRGREPEVAAVRELAVAHDTGVDAVAIAAAMAQPWADVVLSGAVTKEQLTANVAAVEVALTGDDLDRLRHLAQVPADYWESRRGLPWN